MISELCLKDLYALVIEKKSITDAQLLKSIFTQLCIALKTIHKADYCHLDLKTENVFIGADYSIRLADFGHATSTLHPINKKAGTIGYRAPETFIKLNGKVEYNGV